MYFILVLNLLIYLMAIVAAKQVRPGWCHFLADPGPCHQHLRMFAFDLGSDRCLQFTYGGCGGNPNRFESKELCRDICNAPLEYEDQFIITRRRHRTHKRRRTLKPVKDTRTVEEYTKDVHTAVDEGTPGEDSVTEIFKSTKGTTRKITAFKLFNLKQIGLKM